MSTSPSGQLARSTSSFHAAFVGVLSSNPRDERFNVDWDESVARSESRCAKSVLDFVGLQLTAAFRGDQFSAYQDIDYTVMIDGRVDNILDVAGASEPTRNGTMPKQAQLLSRLFSAEGTSLFARLYGSYVVVIVKHNTGEAFLVRDWFGTKPLFFAHSRWGWAWASEIKCICPLLKEVSIDREGLRQAMHYRYMVGETLIEGIRQVMPASFVRICAGESPKETPYWVFEFRPDPGATDIDQWADRTDAAMDAAMARLRREHKDVGVLLSGGVDSSLLAQKAARAGFRQCVAFTARWAGDNPELGWAQDVARHIGIEHRIVDIDDSFLAHAYPWLIWRMEEAPRHYNSFPLAQLFKAAAGFDVLLNGHAADVMFGPQSCVAIDVFMRRRAQLRLIPDVLKRALAGLLQARDGARNARFRNYLTVDAHNYIKTQFQIHYGALGRIAFDQYIASAQPGMASLRQFYDPAENSTERFQRFDLYTFNQSHLSVFDRLGAPLEVVVNLPFLSPEMVAIASALPTRLKFDGAVAKPVLKRLASRYFPAEWIYRTKQGFPTQSSRWLGGPLAEWRKQMVNEHGTLRELIDLHAIEKAEVGRDDEAIWTTLSLQLFDRQFVRGNGGPESHPWA